MMLSMQLRRTSPDSAHAGLWYKFSVPKPMFIEVSTCMIGTTYDPKISILSGDECGELTLIAFGEYGGIGRGCSGLRASQ